ncbi:hypothetical protein B0H13DRAFT_1861629 [Mycena leptocephala]|nr:hypothetical protein B0H13DRAFT_1861629 [Mycena leptocephala]
MADINSHPCKTDESIFKVHNYQDRPGETELRDWKHSAVLNEGADTDACHARPFIVPQEGAGDLGMKYDLMRYFWRHGILVAAGCPKRIPKREKSSTDAGPPFPKDWSQNRAWESRCGILTTRPSRHRRFRTVPIMMANVLLDIVIAVAVSTTTLPGDARALALAWSKGANTVIKMVDHDAGNVSRADAGGSASGYRARGGNGNGNENGSGTYRRPGHGVMLLSLFCPVSQETGA